MIRAVAARLAPPLAALAAALVVSAIIVLVSGADPLLAFSALLQGAFGGTDSVSEVAVKTCPLLLTGLAIAVAFRAGVWNIGAEGQLVVGALAAAWLGTHLNTVPAALGLPLLLLAGALAGAAWGAIAALLKVYRHVNEILSTIMLNFIALGLVSYLVQGPLMESGGRYPQTDAIAPHLWMPRLASPHRVHWGLGVGLVLAGLAQWLLYRSAAGYELRAAGLNRDAARIAGIHVERASPPLPSHFSAAFPRLASSSPPPSSAHSTPGRTQCSASPEFPPSSSPSSKPPSSFSSSFSSASDGCRERSRTPRNEPAPPRLGAAAAPALLGLIRKSAVDGRRSKS
jgi:ABC-type uncharacterized transport system permease subunit